MKLRKLQVQDAPLMLEWMHDDYVVQNMKTDFKHKTLEDCETFIIVSNIDRGNLHLAIVDENDVYMGTVSLKNIGNESAEFAITVRKCAMGNGYAKCAMENIIKIGLNKLKLKKIYWSVSPRNIRAIRFYDKNGYQRCDIPNEIEGYSEMEKRDYIWYMVNNI